MTIIDTLKKRIDHEGSALDLSRKFQRLTQDEDRVKLVMKMCHRHSINPATEIPQKTCTESKKWRDKGNQEFVSNNTSQHYVRACEFYSQSVAHAPPNSDELALAYANRSAVLFRLRKYEECMQDIERCLQSNYPDQLKLKILLRKTECLAILRNTKLEKSYEETVEWIDNNYIEIKKNAEMKNKLNNCYRKTSSLERETRKVKADDIFKDFCYDKINDEVPVASDALAVKYDDTFGRHVVATRDIRPGEILAKETPYCLVLDHNNSYCYCWRCLEYTWNGIPCEHCVNVLYCSEQCRDEAWKSFHDVECAVLALLLGLENMLGMAKLGTTSLRLVILAVRELESIDNLMMEISEVEKCTDLRIKGFSQDGKFHSSRYRSVYSLATNTEKRPVPDLFDRSTYVAVLIYFLATKTEFFGDKFLGNWEELCLNERVTFVGGLMLRHQQIFPSNVHCYAEERNVETYERGSAVMPFFSLANHSCNANVTRSCRKGFKLLFSLFPIQKGEQIFDNYGAHYAVMPKTFRQKILNQQFYFSCKCVACEEDWPLYQEIPSYKVTIKSNETKSIIDKALNNYITYISIALSGEIEETPNILNNLANMIQVLLKYVTLPCKEINDITEMMKRIFDLTGNRFIFPDVTREI